MKNLKQLLLLMCCCMTVCSYARNTATTDTSGSMTCSDNCGCAGSSQTPLGIMTDHVHGKGQWMVSYTYMDMMMKGSRIGTSKIGNDVINEYYVMAPDKMSMQMHMAMVMYGVSDRLTLMAMAEYASNNMYMIVSPIILSQMPGMQGGAMSDNMISKSSGFADTKIYALYSLLNKNNNRIITTAGLNLPTGSTTLSGPTMFGTITRLPYSMQIGTGTFRLLPSVTYITANGHLSWGAQAGADINLGMNHQGYRPGNVYNATAWASYRFLPFLSASLRAESVATGKIKGYDKNIATLMYNDPTADSRNYGGQRDNMYAGLNFSVKKVIHFLFEYGIPVYENLNGPQMSLHANLLAGAQYSF